MNEHFLVCWISWHGDDVWFQSLLIRTRIAPERTAFSLIRTLPSATCFSTASRASTQRSRVLQASISTSTKESASGLIQPAGLAAESLRVSLSCFISVVRFFGLSKAPLACNTSLFATFIDDFPVTSWANVLYSQMPILPSCEIVLT